MASELQTGEASIVLVRHIWPLEGWFPAALHCRGEASLHLLQKVTRASKIAHAHSLFHNHKKERVRTRAIIWFSVLQFLWWDAISSFKTRKQTEKVLLVFRNTCTCVQAHTCTRSHMMEAGVPGRRPLEKFREQELVCKRILV